MSDLVTWTDGSLTRTVSGLSGVKANIGRSSGKWYWEINIDSSTGAHCIGIANSIPSGWVGSGNYGNNARLLSNSGQIFPPWIDYTSVSISGDVIGIAVDLNKGTMDYYINGMHQGVAFNDIKLLGEIYPFITRGASSGSTIITANFGASEFAYEELFKNLYLSGYNSYDNSRSYYLIKQDGSYYSILPEYYDEVLDKYTALDEMDFSKSFDIGTLFNGVEERIIDVTPKMTSDTTPSPYVVSDSGTPSSGSYKGFLAFNKSTTLSSGTYISNSNKCWIQMDFNVSTKINSFSITSRDYVYDINNTPKDFTLQGSNNGIDFDIIKSWTDEVNWIQNETRIYDLDNDVSYRYYRLDITSANGGSYIALSEITFLYHPPTGYPKPIEKFDNFVLVTQNLQTLNLHTTKSRSELITASSDINTSIAHNIDYFNISGNGLFKMAFSTDKGLTWQSYYLNELITLTNTTQGLKYESNGSWDLLKTEIIEKGMDVNSFNNFDFNQLDSKTIRFAYVLIRDSYNAISEVNNLDWKFDAKGHWRQLNDDAYDLYVYDKDMRIISGTDSNMMKITAVR